MSMSHKLQTLFFILALSMSACSFFAPQEPEAFGDLELTVRFSENAALNKVQAIDRVLVIITEAESAQNLGGREIARREFLIGNDRALRAALRVPLHKNIDNCFVAEVLIFERLELLYSGQGFPCFGAGQRSASAEVILDASAFFVSQPFAPLTLTNTRLNSITIFLQDSTLTHFEIITDSVRALVSTSGRRSNVITAPAFVLGDTSTVKIRAWRNLVFKGEVNRRFVYTGRKAEVFIAMTWNSVSDFDLEIVNPAQQIISVNAPGDSINGTLILPDANGFGPELFEWRENPRITQGTFTVNVRRSIGNLVGSGKVYVYLREGQASQRLTVVPFDFRPTDTPLFKTVHSFNWP